MYVRPVLGSHSFIDGLGSKLVVSVHYRSYNASSASLHYIAKYSRQKTSVSLKRELSLTMNHNSWLATRLCCGAMFCCRFTTKQVSKVIWQKAASPFRLFMRWRTHSSAACAGQEHSPTASSEQCRMHSCVTVGWHVSPQRCPFPLEDLNPRL